MSFPGRPERSSSGTIPSLVFASVQDDGDDSGFHLLFAYITGNNRARSTLPKTVSVISGPGSMSFVMPAGRPRDQIPDPLDNRVRITALPAREVTVIRFSGHTGREEVAAAMSRLHDGLRKAGSHLKAPPS